LFPSGSEHLQEIRTEQLRCAADFVRIWPSIAALRRSIDDDPDVSVDPLHFLATTDSSRPSRAIACWRGDCLIGILYARGHRLWGISLGYAVSGDLLGRGSLLCSREDERQVVHAAVECLMRSGVHSLQLRIASSVGEVAPFPGCNVRQFSGAVAGDRLPLSADYEVFLASLGKHTRRNIRYYTRRADVAGIAFVPEVSPEEYAAAVESLRDVAEFSSGLPSWQSFNPMLELHAGKRFLLRDASGKSVAALCGFTRGRRFHLLAQWNDRRLPELSLSLVLRGYTIQHLIATHHTELGFVDGSSLSLGRFCTAIDYRAYFIDRRGWFRSSLKYVFSRLVDLVLPGRVVSNTMGALLGSYLAEERLLRRTALRHPELSPDRGGSEAASDPLNTGALPSSGQNLSR
jgi:Acetyltransferase (GNAT) domain